MKTNLKEINSYTRELDITVSWKTIENEFQQEFNKARARYSIPGFRKGKVPEKIVKNNLGSSIEANFAENSINIYYKQALEKLKIIPINQASINTLDFQEGLDLSFTAQFEVEPEIVLPKYNKKFNIEAIRYIAEDEDVQQTLTQYQEQHAKILTIDSGAKNGHFIKCDLQTLDENRLPEVGNKMKDQYIRLGYGLFKDDTEKIFIGAKEGDEVVVTLKGQDKPLNYIVTIKRVEEQILSDLDDEFAKTVNENTNTLEELKKLTKEQIQGSLDKEHNENINKEIINYFVDNSHVEAPASMVSRYLEQIKHDLKQRNQSFEEEQLKANYQSHAEWNIKWYLIKDQLIINESLNISEEEIDNKIKAMISDNKEDEKKLKSFYRKSENRQRVNDEMLNDKIFGIISSFAKIKVIEKSTKELRKK